MEAPKPRVLLLSLRRPFTSTSTSSPPIDPSLLLRLSTVLYQQQNAPLPKLKTHLQKLPYTPTPELLIQLCNTFPSSWRPIHNFLLLHHHSHLSLLLTPASANKALDVFGRSRNVDLLNSFLLTISQHRLLTPRTLHIAASHLPAAREIKRCVALFDLDPPTFKNLDSLNGVVRTLCARRYVDVAKAVVWKVRESILPDETTYGYLVVGFCRAEDLLEAARVWNRMLDSGLEPDAGAYEEMMVTLFKNNRVGDAMSMFQRMRERRFCDMGLDPYAAVIDWMCKEGRVSYAFMVFSEMLKRGVEVDGATLGALIYGLVTRRRVREGYKVLQGVEEADVSVYHGIMKGLLRNGRASEATQVFREMVERGCDPNMHTYIMLLQGHLGKRGRKGRDPLVNFASIFIGGLVKAGKTLQATKYVERMMWGGVEVPRFDYDKFLHYFSNEEGVVMFEEVGKKLREAGLVDLGDVFLVYGKRMATRDQRRRRARVTSSLDTADNEGVVVS